MNVNLGQLYPIGMCNGRSPDAPDGPPLSVLGARFSKNRHLVFTTVIWLATFRGETSVQDYPVRDETSRKRYDV